MAIIHITHNVSVTLADGRVDDFGAFLLPAFLVALLLVEAPWAVVGPVARAAPATTAPATAVCVASSVVAVLITIAIHVCKH